MKRKLAALILILIALPALALSQVTTTVSDTLHLVRGVPVATFHTTAGPLEMIVDTGASATMFTRRVTATHQRVCFRDFDYCASSLVPVETQNLFFAQRRNKKPRIDGVLGRDVLSRFGRVSIDYERKTVSFGRPSEKTKSH